MFEDVSDLLAGLFGVIHGHVFALLGPLSGVASDALARIYCGVISNLEGLLGAIGGLNSNRLGPGAHFIHGTFGRMYGLIAKPMHGMRGLVRAFSRGVDNDVAAFFADKVGPLCSVFETANGGAIGELDGLDGAVSGLHGDGFRGRIDSIDDAGDDVGGHGTWRENET